MRRSSSQSLLPSCNNLPRLRLQVASHLFSHFALLRVDAAWPRLGRAFRTAPISRQTDPNPVWHSPRFHSRPATLLRPPFCPFHRSVLFLPAAAQRNPIRSKNICGQQKAGLDGLSDSGACKAYPGRGFGQLRRMRPSGKLLPSDNVDKQPLAHSQLCFRKAVMHCSNHKVLLEVAKI